MPRRAARLSAGQPSGDAGDAAVDEAAAAGQHAPTSRTDKIIQHPQNSAASQPNAKPLHGTRSEMIRTTASGCKFQAGGVDSPDRTKA